MLLTKRLSITILSFLLGLTCAAQSQRGVAADWSGRMTLQMGVDAWKLNPSISEDVYAGPYLQDWNLSHSMLGLPSSMSTWHYTPISPWYKFQATTSPVRHVVFSAKIQANQTTGLRIDELSADYAISDMLGIRAGVVDYKLSYCNTYDTQSPWIFEPNMFCSMKYTASVTGGAPGAQVYYNTKFDTYRFQAVGGIYMPGALNYDTEDFGNYQLDGTPQRNDQHLKAGLSFNLLNVLSGTQFRFGWLHTDQSATSEAQTRGRQKSDMTYAGMEVNLTPKLHLKLSRTDFWGRVRLSDSFDPSYSWDGVLSKSHFSNSTAVLRYLVDDNNSLALAYTLYQYDIDNKDVPAALVEATGTFSDGYFMLSRTQTSASWRHNWDSGIFTVAQISYTDLIDGYNASRYKAHAVSAGLRIGITF